MKDIFEKSNLIWGGVVTVVISIFGKYWFLFLGLLLLNIVDYVTGVAKAKFWNKNECSSLGAKGIIKKVSYWIVIGISFFLAYGFTQLGEIWNCDLSFMYLLGWFVLASYIINEIRSILENFVEMGVKIPEILITGLSVTEKILNAKNKEMEANVDEGPDAIISDTSRKDKPTED